VCATVVGMGVDTYRVVVEDGQVSVELSD